MILWSLSIYLKFSTVKISNGNILFAVLCFNLILSMGIRNENQTKVRTMDRLSITALHSLKQLLLCKIFYWKRRLKFAPLSVICRFGSMGIVTYCLTCPYITSLFWKVRILRVVHNFSIYIPVSAVKQIAEFRPFLFLTPPQPQHLLKLRQWVFKTKNLYDYLLRGRDF